MSNCGPVWTGEEVQCYVEIWQFSPTGEEFRIYVMALTPDTSKVQGSGLEGTNTQKNNWTSMVY